MFFVLFYKPSSSGADILPVTALAAATAGPLPDRAEEEEDFEIFDLDE
ncbi:MAG: hypothetical protein HFI28_14075 [Lachnospiraceae bacterium]|nr:hypothetical protein [Lachnospiraceae bacterium]